MERVIGPQRDVIAASLSWVPDRWRELVACDFFCGDALFAGLWRPEWCDELTPDGRSYRRTPHCGFPYHSRDKRLVVVLPGEPDVETVIHELGHVAHWKLQERAGGFDKLPDFDPVSDYARTNHLEAFAEAFLGWFYTPCSLDGAPYWTGGYSRLNEEFFDRLLA